MRRPRARTSSSAAATSCAPRPSPRNDGINLGVVEHEHVAPVDVLGDADDAAVEQDLVPRLRGDVPHLRGHADGFYPMGRVERRRHTRVLSFALQVIWR